MDQKRRLISQKFLKKSHLSLSLITALLLLCGHDLYIKMDSYFLAPNQEATISLYNGTFERSENLITRDRMLDASLVSHGERKAISPEQWYDQDSTITQLSFSATKEGTYVAGVSTKARNIELEAEKFNSYLEHDGVLDMLEYRSNNDLLEQDAVESYQKHVKAIYQVGELKTSDWSTVLGYPIEFVPQTNPYESFSGESLSVQLLLDGKPLPNQLVYADFISTSGGHSHTDDQHEHAGETHSHQHQHEHEEHSHKHEHDEDDHQHSHQSAEAAHSHTSGQQLRTDAQGLVNIELPEDGIYYVRTIHMLSLTDSDELTHQSKWATLTFEVTHQHGSSKHTHDDHEHDLEDGIPTWGFVLVSLLIIGLLFMAFRSKS